MCGSGLGVWDDNAVSMARVERPSTFWVIRVNVASGAISERIEGNENAARARWAAFGCAFSALSDVIVSAQNQNLIKT